MTDLLVYSLKSALVMALLYVPFMLLLRKESFFWLNRMVLVAILLLAILLPMFDFHSLAIDNRYDTAASQLINESNDYATWHPMEISPGNNKTTSLTVHITPTQIPWQTIVLCIYIVGILILSAVRIFQLLRLRKIIHGDCLWKKTVGKIKIYCHKGDIPAFSWMRNIVISEADYYSNGREILMHEKGHVMYRHSLDIILLSVVEVLQWWNPTVYALGKSLRDVHEYEADDYVLRSGTPAKQYQMLLVSRAAGSESYGFVNSFNHSLIKKRIIMMKKMKPSKWQYGYLIDVNIVTKNVSVPSDVTWRNSKPIVTVLLPGNNEIYVRSDVKPAKKGNWMNCSVTSWGKNQWGYDGIRQELRNSMDKPGFKVYIYASTETMQREIDRMKSILKELKVNDYKVVKDIPIRHPSATEFQQWAKAEKAKGTAYKKLFDVLAPTSVACADISKHWHVVNAVYGKK